jgi:hypothetical protein
MHFLGPELIGYQLKSIFPGYHVSRSKLIFFKFTKRFSGKILSILDGWQFPKLFLPAFFLISLLSKTALFLFDGEEDLLCKVPQFTFITDDTQIYIQRSRRENLFTFDNTHLSSILKSYIQPVLTFIIFAEEVLNTMPSIAQYTQNIFLYH